MDIKKEIQNTYDHIAEEYDKEFSQEIYFLDEIRFFKRQLPKEAQVLDVGCGPGHIASYMKDSGFVITGIDFSDNMIELAKKRCRQSKFIKKDIEQFDYGKEKYNGIIASFILIHFNRSSTEKLLHRFHSSLDKKGVLLISVIKGKGEHFRPEPLNSKHNMYFRYMTEKDIKGILEKTGFRITRFKEIQKKTEHMRHTSIFIVAEKE